jgi:flagellar protein FliL
MNKNMGFILTAIIAAIFSAAATVYFLLNSSFLNDHLLTMSSSTPVALPPSYIKFDNLVSNLNSTDGDNHYVSVGVTLKVENDEAQTLINSYAPLLKNDIVMTISSKNYNEITDKKDEIRQELLKQMNADLAKEGVKYTISDVLFSSFVAQ